MTQIMISTTYPKADQARATARVLLKARLAASVQMLGPMESHYWWEEEIHEAREWLCLIKSTATQFDRVAEIITANHPYAVPEIFATPLGQGTAPYLNWINQYAGTVEPTTEA